MAEWNQWKGQALEVVAHTAIAILVLVCVFLSGWVSKRLFEGSMFENWVAVIEQITAALLLAILSAALVYKFFKDVFRGSSTHVFLAT